MTSNRASLRNGVSPILGAQVFTADSEKMVRTLDDLLGSRRATVQLLAFAAAAVLTAFPYDERHEYVKSLSRDRSEPKLRRLDFAGGTPREISVELRDAVLLLVLNALEHDHDGDRTRILNRLQEASSLALSGATDELGEWTRILGASHDHFLRERLSSRTDLN